MKACGVLLVATLCVSLALGQDEGELRIVPEETMQRLLIHKVHPILPEPGMHVQDPVVLKAVIDKAGRIASLELINGYPVLVPRAMEAVKEWRYRPYEVNGIPTAVETTIYIEFSPTNDSSSPSDSSSQSPVAVTADKINGHIIGKVSPVYPPLARQARIQGTVVLKIIIDKAGNVSNLQLVSGHPMLAPSAIEAVKQWKYTPYELNGEIVEVDTTVQVNFKLADDPPNGGGPYVLQSAENTPSGMVGVVGGIISSVPVRPLEGERVSELAMRPLRIQKINPLYPGVAVQRRIQGMVVLDMRVNSAGGVEEVVRISGPPTLAPPAMEAVRQWKYSPYLKDGMAISVVSTVRLNFSLEENASNGVVNEPPASEETGPPRITMPLRVRVSSGVSSGLLVKKVAPEYPTDARAASIEGTVVLQANIDKEGNVSNLELISGHPMLAPAATEAVRQWKYRPYLLNGQVVEVQTTIQVNFVLSH